MRHNKLRVIISSEDFSSGIYLSPYACALSKALYRKFRTRKDIILIKVGGTEVDLYVKEKIYRYLISERDATIIANRTEKQNQFQLIVMLRFNKEVKRFSADEQREFHNRFI